MRNRGLEGQGSLERIYGFGDRGTGCIGIEEGEWYSTHWGRQRCYGLPVFEVEDMAGGFAVGLTSWKEKR